jgi:hypothetical protein
MKKHLLIFAAMLLFVTMSYSQASFTTGAIGVDVNEYGKIELFNSAGIYQLWRTSILVGKSSTAVFDYQNDAEQNEPTVLVSSPLNSDFEIYGAYDNTYSGAPPAVTVKLNAYAWTGGGYIIFKFNITNNEAVDLTASAGLDIIPYIDEIDGYDSVTYNSAEDVIRIHRGTQTNIGMKLLSSSLSSLVSFEYYDGYYVDSDYWTWMNYGSVQPFYPSNSDAGSVSITSQAPVTLAPGASFNVFYAMALGADEPAMLANIAAAKTKYDLLTVSVKENQLAAGEFTNYPNPFKSSTTISYQLPGNGSVSVKVFDALGKEKATLVNENQSAGMHTIDFDAKDMPGGVYSYRLTFNDQVISNKMLLIK